MGPLTLYRSTCCADGSGGDGKLSEEADANAQRLRRGDRRTARDAADATAPHLEENDGVVAADGGLQKRLRVRRSAACNELDACETVDVLVQTPNTPINSSRLRSETDHLLLRPEEKVTVQGGESTHPEWPGSRTRGAASAQHRAGGRHLCEFEARW